MKDAEDEAFDELAKRQGGGFPAKRAMAADKLQEPEREALKLALEALDAYDYGAARIIIHEALAQPAQEPVAWMHVQGNYEEPSFRQLADDEVERGWRQYPLYTTPPQRQWVGLTDEEIDHQAKKDDYGVYFALGALWAGAKLKERNS